MVDLIREEPDTAILVEKRLLTERHGQLTFEEMEKLPIPLSKDDYKKITEYVTGLLQSTPTWIRSYIIGELFLKPKHFSTILTGPTDYRNRQLFAVSALWQEMFVNSIVYERDEETEEQTRQLLHSLSFKESTYILSSIYQWSTRPSELYPLPNAPETGIHRIFDEAISDYTNKLPVGQEADFIYGDEVAETYFKTTILSRLESRFQHFGLGEDYSAQIEDWREVIEASSFEEDHLKTLKSLFEQSVGREFLDKLNAREEDISAITREVWEEISTQMRYLPLEHGIEVVNLSDNDVADILHLEEVRFRTRESSSPDWTTDLSFKLKGSRMNINGVIDQDGHLTLRAALDKHIPGLYAMLNLIGVLALRDLVVQTEHEQPTREKNTEDSSSPHPTNHKETERSLPRQGQRQQTSRQLIDAVYAAREVPKRRQSVPVGVYKRPLPFSQAYSAAVALYNEASSQEVSDITLEWLGDELNKAREKAYKFHTSESKRNNVPARFKLDEITDPVTGEDKTLETWVIEHRNPKPTAEELQNLTLLYERHFKSGSALALLGELTPWFIGQQ